MTAHRLAEGITGRHVFWGLVAFFGVMLIANAIFLYYAVATFNGFATSDAYRKGLDYNNAIAAGERQAKRGWQTELGYDRKGRRLRLKVSRPDGQPVSGLRVEATLGRPVTDSQDRSLSLTEIAPSVYETHLRLDDGQWIVSAKLFDSRSAADPAFQLKQRLWVSSKP